MDSQLCPHGKAEHYCRVCKYETGTAEEVLKAMAEEAIYALEQEINANSKTEKQIRDFKKLAGIDNG